MPCITTPTLPIPQLPAPLSISIELPIPSISIGLCCKLPIPPIPIPPIPLPAVVLNPAIIATLNAYIRTAVEYISSIPLNCPLDDEPEA